LLWERCENPFLLKFRIVKIHGKDEHYIKFAEVRGIYSRHDVFKVLVGPVFAAISKKMFKHEYFFKYIKHEDRMSYFLERMSVVGTAWGTDHTSFEASFLEMQLTIEFQFYRFCVMANPLAKMIIEYAEEVLIGENTCVSKYFVFRMLFKRYSGEMNTSTGNTYYNEVLGAFVSIKSGNKLEQYMNTNLTEGDDEAAKTSIVPKHQIYEALGHIVKLDIFDDPCMMSFCGMVFDEDARAIVVNPIEKILEFGWCKHEYFFATDKKYKSLIKAKSMSILYSYGACPMISVVGRKFFELTHDADETQAIKSKSISSYELDRWKTMIESEILFQDIDDKTRHLVEKKYSIPIDTQIRFEQYINSFTEIQPICFPELLDYCKHEYIFYYDTYSMDVSRDIKTPGKLAEQFL
jgi:hypothetical protein